MPLPATTLFQTSLFRHSLVLLVATQVGNMATMMFQVVMMRQLSVAEYGILASMLSLILIMGTPLEALRTAVAHQTALLVSLQQGGALKSFWLYWAKILSRSGLIIAIIGMVFVNPLTQLFQLPSIWPMAITIIIIAASLFIPCFAGALQGVQAFFWMALHGQVWGVVRLLAAIIVIGFLGPTAVSGLLAQSIGVVASIAVGLIAISFVLRIHEKPFSLPFSGVGYFLLSLTVLAGYAVIMNVDVALVKLLFEPDDAGTFARAATIGRSIVFLPVPIAAAMFPKVVSVGFSSVADRRLLLKAITWTTALIVFPALFCTVFMGLLWQLFTGETADPETLSLARRIMWALAPLGLTFLLVNFEIAQHRFRAPLTLIAIASAYVLTVYFAHNDSLKQVVFILSCATVCSLVVMLFDMLRTVYCARVVTSSQT